MRKMECNHFEVKSLVVNIILIICLRLSLDLTFNAKNSRFREQFTHNYRHSYHIVVDPTTVFKCTRALSFKSYAPTTILQRLSVMMVCKLFIIRHRHHTHVAK